MRLWRGFQRGRRAFIEEMRRNPAHRPLWPFKYAVWQPTFFAVLLSASILIGDSHMSLLGSGAPAFFSFFSVPFMLISYLLLRQQKVIEELRAKIEANTNQRVSKEES